MRLALDQAERAAAIGEVPVGAVLIDDQDGILAADHNRSVTSHDPTAHAELLVIRAACLKQGNYRLPRCTLFVTLEPCSMCLGAMIWARLTRLVFGAFDPKCGCAGSVFNLAEEKSFNHTIEVTGGLMKEASINLLRTFFGSRRAKQLRLPEQPDIIRHHFE
ncbi:MAG: nucleoside deaminase [Deltaproteobacteria bacterium]|nr:nucleoside deaminase [Deltaproteobacteria bacterium]MBF0526104.1 nucleoside deaminase [Deltaproteobacteria bacterium]